jgi:hypothetical protein
MERVQRVIGKVEPHDSAERYTSLGVDCIEGEARITSPYTVEVGGRSLTTRAIVLATGASPLVPPIPGLDKVDYLTSNNLWALRELPPRLLVLGGGPAVSVEFARKCRCRTIQPQGNRCRFDAQLQLHLDHRSFFKTQLLVCFSHATLSPENVALGF